jgi:hypothetical protein
MNIFERYYVLLYKYERFSGNNSSIESNIITITTIWLSILTGLIFEILQKNGVITFYNIFIKSLFLFFYFILFIILEYVYKDKIKKLVIIANKEYKKEKSTKQRNTKLEFAYVLFTLATYACLVLWVTNE